MASGDDKGRQPKDMKGLLQLCTSVTDPNASENQTATGGFTQMEPDKKEFLAKALAEMNVDPVKRIKECIRLVKTNDDVDLKLQALEEILEWTQQIDYAMDFHKVGGFEIIKPLLNDEDEELRWTCFELIGDLVQNNPYCQNAVIEYGLLPVILDKLDQDSDPTVKTKALYALSCLARENPDSQKAFVAANGFSVLMRAMQTDVEKLKIKASFLLNNMCTNDPAHKDTLCDIGMVEQLIGLISQEHSQYHEHMMAALLTLLTDHTRAREIAGQSDLHLEDIIQQRLALLKDKEEFLEEYEYSEQILKLIKNNHNDNQDIIR